MRYGYLCLQRSQSVFYLRSVHKSVASRIYAKIEWDAIQSLSVPKFSTRTIRLVNLNNLEEHQLHFDFMTRKYNRILRTFRATEVSDSGYY